MISRFEKPGPQAGVTLFETVVSLAVLSVILAVAATAIRPPSPRLQSEAALSKLMRDAQDARLRSITEAVVVPFNKDALCEGAEVVRFYPDGSGTGGPLCVGGQIVNLRPLTGTLVPGS